MSALSYFLERDGIMTTGISLVRENTESMQPPRALWVSFPLGRPLGMPQDAGFQLEVIDAALDLLNRSTGPVLADFPKDVPPLESDGLAACPVAFPKISDNQGTTWAIVLTQEFELLEPWYELGLRRRDGRTLVGIAPQTPAENIARLGRHLDEEDVPTDLVWLKTAVEDLKAYYSEAMSAQPGEYDYKAQQNLFWQDTSLGAAIIKLFWYFQHSDNNAGKLFARALAPREAVGAATGPTRGPTNG